VKRLRLVAASLLAARSALADAGWELDTALVMIAAGLDPKRARERLQATGGAIEEAMR
jgi:N-acetylmuramic acid 6-phosphate (MurNAc-6-P) etherase